MIDLRNDPKAFVAEKKPIPLEVDFAQAEGQLDTLEGKVTYAKGDALVTGTKGERWPIQRDIFEKTYAAEPPLEMGQKGKYTKLPLRVFALQVTENTNIELSGNRGMLAAKAGDYIVQYAINDLAVVAKEIFEKTYLY